MVEEKKKKKVGFVNTIFHEGNINTLLGPPGTGKTNLAVYFMEKAEELGYSVWTTVHFFKYSQVGQACEMGRLPKGIRYRKVPQDVHTVKTLSQLLLGLLEGRKNIVILDEAGIFASSTSPMSRKVRELKELAYVIRHLNASLLLIAQARGSIAPDLRSTLVTYEMRISKKGRYRNLVVKKARPVKNDEGEEEVRFVQVGPIIGGIPLTRFPWDGFFIPKFEFDIKLEEAFNRLGEYNSMEILDEGPRIIKEMLEEKEEKALKKKEKGKKKNILKTIKENPTLTSEEIAYIAECSPSYVRDLRRRSKKGSATGT